MPPEHGKRRIAQQVRAAAEQLAGQTGFQTECKVKMMTL